MTGSEIYNSLASYPNFREQFPMLCTYGTPVKPMTRPLIGREKQLRQLKAGLLRPELCNVLLLAEAGAGKALANDTLIPVADERGYVAIGDLKENDYVFDENGKPTRVLGVYPQGSKDAYSVVFADGAEIVCNDEHLWDVRKRGAHYVNGSYKTMTLRAMMDYGIVRDISAGSVKSFYVPMNGALERSSKNYTLHPYVLGVLLNCGDLEGKDEFCISSDDEFVIHKVSDLIGANAVKIQNSCDWYFIKRHTSGNAHIQQRELADNCNFTCVFYTKSTERRIPRQYIVGSIEQRYELLRGLMDTNGYATSADGCNYSFITNNELLVEDVIELVRSLGMRASVITSADDDDQYQSKLYNVRISRTLDAKLSLFSFPHYEIETDRRHQNVKVYDDLAIDSVTKLDTQVPMTCIYVASPSHLFQAGKEHIVTHNTALVQGAMAADTKRVYLEIDISKMIADLRDNNEMAVKIKALFDEAAQFVKKSGTEIVLFIDEFHLICMLSDAAVEALKPQLADSGTRGIRVIVATTFTEFREHISKNQPLVQRLQRIEVLPPSKDAIVSILQSFAKVYGVADKIRGTYLYEQIIELSNRYIPANSQPRKSILLLDAMVGCHRAEPDTTRMDINLLYDVLKNLEGIELNVSVDAVSIKKRLDSKVFAQYLATSAVASRLQITSADLNNKTKPMGSFLFTGSTGVGKSILNSTHIPVYVEDGSIHYKLNGELEIGDYVFNREGKPVMVTGVFPQGELDVYEVELTDGRKLLCNGEHIWTYKSRFGNGSKNWRNATTEELMHKNSNKYYNQGRNAANIKFVIPMNKPVQWSAMDYKLHPYIAGVLIRDGNLYNDDLIIGAPVDLSCVAHVAELTDDDRSWRSYQTDGHVNCVLCNKYDTVLSDVIDAFYKSPYKKYIPEVYRYGSVEQRWALIQGLFDNHGVIDGSAGRYSLCYNTRSEQLAKDIQDVLYSLGVSSTITHHKSNGRFVEYHIHVKVGNQDKEQFFFIERKRQIAREAALSDANKTRIKKFGDVIGIRDIRKLDYKEPMTCIMVDDPEHLYQAGDFIVTHNTELTKQLAEIMFADPRRLIRFDMTEYSQPSSLERFRTEVTTKVWERPYSVLLFDEIEKACGEVTRILLQVLDDGRLIDQNNREVSFLNTYIVLTTNAASEIYETVGDYVNDVNMSEAEQIKALGKYMKVIRRAIVEGTGGGKFPPELLGRVDAICPFMPLSEETQRKILEKRMEKLRLEVEQKHGLKLTYATEEILRFILLDRLDTESNSGGARIVATKFEENVVIEVARIINMINSNTNPALSPDNVSGIYVNVDGEMAADNKMLLEGNASIVAHPVNKDGLTMHE